MATGNHKWFWEGERERVHEWFRVKEQHIIQCNYYYSSSTVLMKLARVWTSIINIKKTI